MDSPHSYPIIAIIGRPNVGKSTLFNRLVGRREAITSHEAGTTRDRHFGVMAWHGMAWTVVDTAGVLFEDELSLEGNTLQEAMEEQVAIAIEDANLVGLVVDGKAGIHPDDRKIVELLRQAEKPTIILVNKADNFSSRMEAESFHALGITPVFPVSAIHGTGMSDFVDYLRESLPSTRVEDGPAIPRVTVIGRPNVGKSTLLNRILDQNRAVVSDVPGTTRDSIEANAHLPSGTPFIFVDTAGLRRRGKIEPGIEKFSLFRTIRAINYSDVVIILLTIEEIPTRGDAHVAAYALEANKDVIVVLNKGDLAAQNIFRLKPSEQQKLAEKFLRRFPFIMRLPIYFISAQTGQGIDKLLQVLDEHITKRRNLSPRGGETSSEILE